MPCYVRGALFKFNLFDTSVVSAMPSGMSKDSRNDTSKTATRNRRQTPLFSLICPPFSALTESFLLFNHREVPPYCALQSSQLENNVILK